MLRSQQYVVQQFVPNTVVHFFSQNKFYNNVITVIMFSDISVIILQYAIPFFILITGILSLTVWSFSYICYIIVENIFVNPLPVAITRRDNVIFSILDMLQRLSELRGGLNMRQFTVFTTGHERCKRQSIIRPPLYERTVPHLWHMPVHSFI